MTLVWEIEVHPIVYLLDVHCGCGGIVFDDQLLCSTFCLTCTQPIHWLGFAATHEHFNSHTCDPPQYSPPCMLAQELPCWQPLSESSASPWTALNGALSSVTSRTLLIFFNLLMQNVRSSLPSPMSGVAGGTGRTLGSKERWPTSANLPWCPLESAAHVGRIWWHRHSAHATYRSPWPLLNNLHTTQIIAKSMKTNNVWEFSNHHPTK